MTAHRSQLDTLINNINNQLGGEVLHLGANHRYGVDYLSTGLLPFDVVMGGGLPYGRMTEVYGAWSTLKSYVGLNAIREAQKRGQSAALIDTEHAFDQDWARQVGVDTTDLIVSQPESGEMAFDAMEALVRSDINLLVIDSVAATLPATERDKRMHGETIQPGRLAALMSTGLRKITTANGKTAILWINQLREQVGVTFGNPEKPAGGRALPYYASIRLNVQKVGKVTVDRRTYTGDKWEVAKDLVGQKFKVVIDKSKLDRPHRTVNFTWDLSNGVIDETGFLINAGIEGGLITSSGAYYSTNGKRVQGKEKLRALVMEDPETRQSLLDALPMIYGDKSPGPSGRHSSKGSAPSAASSETKALDSTQDQAADASSSTAARKTRSSKSRKPAAATV